MMWKRFFFWKQKNAQKEALSEVYNTDLQIVNTTLQFISQY